MIYAIWNISITIAISLIGPPLPVIGFSGILVITHIIINIRVPPIPMKYHILPHLFSIGMTQKIWAIPEIIKNIPEFGFLPITLGTNERCNIPAMAVVAAPHNTIC